MLVLSLSLAGCEATPPEVDPIPSSNADAGVPSYVDFVVSYTEAGSPVTCSESVGNLCTVQTGSCANHAVLGAPDGRSFDLEGGGQLEVGFLCQPIVDRAPNSNLSPDFRVVGTLSGGGGILSVSVDGSAYTVLDTIVRDNQEFDLANEGLEFVRFVRIASESGATLSIDAIEVLQ
jgi:hypothetical protein